MASTFDRTNSSLSWDYFDKCVSESGKERKAVCKACKCEIRIPNRNTSNLKQHLKKHHWPWFRKLEDDERKKNAENSTKKSESLVPNKGAHGPMKGQMTLQQTLSGKWDRTNPRAKIITSKLTTMICKDILPFKIVESASFRSLLFECEPRYELPCRATISQELVPALYRETQDRVVKELKNATAVAFTTDSWTSKTNVGYLSFTAHFVSQDFELKDYCIAVKPVYESHTAEHLKDMLISIMDENGFDRSGATTMCAVADNAKNIQNALKQAACFTVLPCFGHTIQLIIHDGLDDGQSRGLKFVIAKCRNICSHFHRSSVATAKLSAVQEQLKVPRHKLIQDVSTRWNSTYLMLSRLLEQKQSISTVLSEIENVNGLTAYEWRLISEACDCLKPFQEITSLMSGSKYPTISLVIPVLNFLVTLLKNEIGLNNLKSLMLNSINKRFGNFEFNELYAVSTILDPRFRHYIFESTEAVETTRKIILQKMVTSADSTETELPVVSETKGNSVVGSMAEYMNRKLNKSLNETLRSDSKEYEMQLYFTEPVTEKNVCPFSWWKHNKNRFPALSALAVKYLSIPATSVESERMFSKAGEVIRDKRTRLNPHKAEMVITLAANL